MDKPTSPSFLPLALVLVLLALVVGGAIFLFGEGALPQEIEAKLAVEAERARALEAVELAQAAERAERESRASVAESSAAPIQTEEAATENDPEPSGVLVRLDVDACPWLDRTWFGTVLWKGAGLEATEHEIADSAFLLPSEPRALEEFLSIECAGLLAVAYELASAEDAPAIAHDGAAPRVPDLVLRARVDRGALLVWADGVPFAERTEVSVAFGGSMAPPSRATYSFGRDYGLAEARSSLVLPLELPRAAVEKSVWVGAPGKEWRSFPVAPNASQVEVRLASAASVRVRHDGPTEPTSYVVTTTYPSGDTQRVPITNDEPVVVSELAAASTRIWIEQREDEPLSRIERRQLAAGEEALVDLRAESALDGRGGVRITLSADRKTLGLARDELEVRISRRTSPESEFPWEHYAMFEPELVAGETFVREILGLDPALHRIEVDPFGAGAVVEVEAGVVKDVEIPLDTLGFVEFVLPEGVAGSGGYVSLSTTEEAFEDRRHVSFNFEDAARSGASPVARGTYTASVRFFGSDDAPELASEPFVVETGETTTVELVPRRTAKLRVTAVDADTGEPVALDLDFWVGVRIDDVETGEPVRGMTSFAGSGDTYTGTESELPWTEGAVRLVPPESPFFDFEPLEPFFLSEDTEVMLRARAK
ncbi:hypothetical protein Pla163_37760 [Planctomycetes bacterium Pla163]|uniref:Uncharacterized protein n=2 Tax=Rohdeia mirabilis TaxID=2528008 RepID=A0A518D570_9BACT|nr:hypothetical protein Pla163_37760 [Planctomycetes bacterium Pla163]